jgi:hypothetical protein
METRKDKMINNHIYASHVHTNIFLPLSDIAVDDGHGRCQYLLPDYVILTVKIFLYAF